MADELFRWLRLMADGSDATAMGLPVYFRAVLQKSGDHHTLTPPLRWDEADNNVVVVLVDDAIATNKDWREALRILCTDASASTTSRTHILPVMVDRSFDLLAFLAVKHQPIRVFDQDDPPLPPRSDPSFPQSEQAHRARRIRRLRRGLTENIVRLVRAPKGDEQTDKLEVWT
jgi:hypothetical protein